MTPAVPEADSLSPSAEEAPRPRTPADRLAFLLSAVLSPYIVLPVGTLAIIYGRATPRDPYWLWIAISVFFSTIFPVLYILYGIKRGHITDVHIMERDQRGGPFLVVILGSVIAAIVLHLMHAPKSVWGLSVILAVNGAAIMFITRYTKISVHSSVLAATVLGATILNPQSPLWPLALVPVLVWARWKRGRHSIWQGVSGALVSSVLTTLVILSLNMNDRLKHFIERII